MLLSSNSLTAQSTVSPSGETIIDSWIHALGGHQKIERIKNIYQYGATVEGGLQAVSKSGRRRTGNIAVSMKYRSRFDPHDIRWPPRLVSDWNGKVHDLQGADLQNEFAEAYQSSYFLLIPDRIHGKVEFLGAMELADITF